MNKNIHKKVMDITGVDLSPEKASVCSGNGACGFECCCDECDYFLLCFTEFEVFIKENIAAGEETATK